LVIPARDVEAVIAHKYVKAVTLTGSENAGKMVAAAAGKYLKKAVLELGGSDPCIILDDANIELAAQVGVQSRMLTTGQTCIAAKRFIVVKQVAQKFFDQLQMQLEKYTAGDPLKYETMLAPLAKKSFVNQVHKQVEQSVKMGAKLLAGDKKPRINSCFYNPVILSDVTPGMPVFDQETFGPVIACTVVDNVDEAVKLANQSPYGLGASIWTENILLGEKIARKIEAGAVFVNGLVRSDPRLPFGGIKNSGFGRELSHYGIKEFCNIKSIWIR
jgi:succinate-semialdehyde dehydrogenase/glutarate-semialdehyde dehydrogenase